MTVADVQAALNEVKVAVAHVEAALALVAEAPPLTVPVADPAADAATEAVAPVDPTEPRAYNPGSAEDTGA